MHCREWSAGKVNAEVQMLVEANGKPHDIVIYKDGSVTRGRSGWGFSVKRGGRTVHEDSGAHRVMTSSLTMEVEAVTHAILWPAPPPPPPPPAWPTDYTCHHFHRLTEPPAKGGVWNGLSRLPHSHAQSSASKTSVDLLPWACRSQ